MLIKNKFILSIVLYFVFFSFSAAKENYYNEAIKNFEKKENYIKILEEWDLLEQ